MFAVCLFVQCLSSVLLFFEKYMRILFLHMLTDTTIRWMFSFLPNRSKQCKGNGILCVLLKALVLVLLFMSSLICTPYQAKWHV